MSINGLQYPCRWPAFCHDFLIDFLFFSVRIFYMPDNKTILQTLQDFSKKFEAFSQRGGVRISQPDEERKNLKNLQEQINQQEEERIAQLRAQFEEFAMPKTQDIEEDEENLTKAYEFFCQIKELTEKSGDNKTHLKSLSLVSPLCHKADYTGKNSSRFAFLRLWFLATNPEAKFVPEISEEANGTYSLDFIELELWHPASFEKEIMQIL